MLEKIPFGKQGITIALTVILFFINGAEFAQGFLESNVAQEALGAAAMLVAVALGFVVRARREKAGQKAMAS